jgi:ATP synthase protein I
MTAGLGLDRPSEPKYCAPRREFREFIHFRCLSVLRRGFLAFCVETAYRGKAKEKGRARRVGEGNGDDGPQSQGEGQVGPRQHNEGPAQDNKILRARLEKLSEALAAQHRDERQVAGKGPEGASSSPAGLGNVLSLAFRVLSEFVAAVLVGAAIGWGIDQAAGTSPIFLIVFLLMGSAAGLWNVYRIGTEKTGAQR